MSLTTTPQRQRASNAIRAFAEFLARRRVARLHEYIWIAERDVAARRAGLNELRAKEREAQIALADLQRLP